MLLESTQVQTIIREISADLETPVSLYLKLRGDGASFLLESVEGGERIARYSFIGVQPKALYILRDEEIEIQDVHGSRTLAPGASAGVTHHVLRITLATPLSFYKMNSPASPPSACRTRRASRAGWWAFSGSSRFGFLNQLSARK